MYLKRFGVIKPFTIKLMDLFVFYGFYLLFKNTIHSNMLMWGWSNNDITNASLTNQPIFMRRGGGFINSPRVFARK